jgi:fatty acid synthase subunit beta
LLHTHIDDYRRYLEKRIRVQDVRPEQLVGKWVPNVLGKPFALEREYVEDVQRVVGGRRLGELIRGCA